MATQITMGFITTILVTLTILLTMDLITWLCCTVYEAITEIREVDDGNIRGK